MINSSNNAVTGNIISDHGDAVHGIKLGSGSSYNTVIGNICKNNASGIWLDNGTGNIVTDNICFRGSGATADYTAATHTVLIGANASANYFCGNNVSGKDYTDQSGGANTIIHTPADSTLSNVEDLAFYDKAIALGLVDNYMLQTVQDVAQANRAIP